MLRWREPCWPCGGVVGDHAAEAHIAELRIGQVSPEKYGPVQVGSGQVVRPDPFPTTQAGPKTTHTDSTPPRTTAARNAAITIFVRLWLPMVSLNLSVARPGTKDPAQKDPAQNVACFGCSPLPR
jgi:hypothetical protein